MADKESTSKNICANCKRNSVSSCKSLKCLPDIIAIHPSQDPTKKIFWNENIPIEIEIKRKESTYMYKLATIANHSGYQSYGHCTAYWYTNLKYAYFDDNSKVVEFDVARYQDRSRPYILFYEKN